MKRVGYGLLLMWALLPLWSQATTPTLKNVMEQDTPSEEVTPKRAPETPPTVADEFERGSPRSSMEGLLHAMRYGDFDQAGHYLDTRNLPDTVAALEPAELARQLKVVLDRTLWVDLQSMSNSKHGQSEDGLPSYRDLVGKIAHHQRQVSVYMQRVPRGDGESIWKISNATLSHIPELYRIHGDGPIGEFLSQHLPAFEVMGLQSWQVVALLLFLLIAYVLSWPLFWLTNTLIGRRGDHTQHLQRFISGPIRLLLLVLVIRQTLPLIRPSIEAQAFAEGRTLLIIAFLWVVVAGLELTRQHLMQVLRERGKDQGALLMRPLFTVAKTLVILTGLLLWLENLGFKATTILAGLGIGGLAVALAAQKSVENLIGAITLYMSTPVRVGNFCRFGTQMGVVEEIGLRYTRIRTLDRTVIHISNATFVDLQLENFSEREKIRFSPTLHLRYDTRASQLRPLMDAITDALQTHEMVDEAPVRVRFHKFGPQALQLSILSYINTTDFPVYLEAAEELNLTILTLLEQHKVALADATQRRLSHEGTLLTGTP
ncbi:MscS family membrane protein [Ferrimonas sediminum]|uniref:MscS family membrane protein n=1 Tax=Ferrimonas sediminum TaxID=718193 RepID=A0A1G8XMA7_9GAMM|nr:mechanosensitive ion channel family protein [Ferrimonas sediminum]SDJ91526.1 MscS family membrane protein [Ferrimonas sediminum]